MLLPFVRELFAEVEQLPAFTRAASHLRESAGRISVTGLSPAAKALVVVLLRRTIDVVGQAVIALAEAGDCRKACLKRHHQRADLIDKCGSLFRRKLPRR